MPKPARTYTRRLTLLNVVMAWVAVFGAIWLGHEMATAVVPVMVILIASLLGIYQGVGHFDLRTIAAANGRAEADEPSYGDQSAVREGDDVPTRGT